MAVLKGQRMRVVLVGAGATADGRSQLDSLRALLLGGRQGVVLSRGTWHPLDCCPVDNPYSNFPFISAATT